MIKISVIMPVYNVELFLSQCLDSLINQTLTEIEIICVDDGSTDGSYAILQEYAQKDNRIIILQQQNTGAGAARNVGMQIAQGKYLSILDSDDYFELDMLEQAYLRCEEHNADICVFRSDRFDTENGKTESIPWTIKQNFLPNVLPFSAERIYPHIFQIFNGWAWDKLYRREFVERSGLTFQSIRSTNDAFFVFMATIQAKNITIVDDILVHHRANIKTSLSVTREKCWDCCWQAIYAIQQELIKRHQYAMVEQSFINWALHFLLWNVHTLQEESKLQLIRAMQEQYFTILELNKYSREYFYNQNEYREYLQIIQSGRVTKSKLYAFNRVLQHCRDNGVRATMKRIIEKIR